MYLEVKLGEIVNNISSGKNKERNSEGVYNVYGSTGVIGKCNDYVFDKDHILVARDCPARGLFHVVPPKVAAVFVAFELYSFPMQVFPHHTDIFLILLQKFDYIYLLTNEQKILIFDMLNGLVYPKHLYGWLDKMADKAKELYLGVKNDETSCRHTISNFYSNLITIM